MLRFILIILATPGFRDLARITILQHAPKYGAEGGTRTLKVVTPNGFQDRPITIIIPPHIVSMCR